MRATGFIAAIVTGVLLFSGMAHGGPATTQAASTRELVDVTVDPRVELFSLIWKLAGNEEYNQGRLKNYNQDIEQRFGPFRDDPVIKLARRLREQRGVGFDAPMRLAMRVSQPPELKLLIPLDPWPDDFDRRWTPDTVTRFLEEAREFAIDHDFAKFLDEHRPLCDLAAQRMRQTLAAKAKLEWFDEFFGPHPDVRFHIHLALANGPNNYGSALRTKTSRDYYCILGVWRCDSEGMPTFSGPRVVPTVVHEFAHCYTNRLVERHETELAAGEALYAPVAKLMQQQAYADWQTMLRESLVRVTVVRYRFAIDGPLAATGETTEQVTRGFKWMPELSALILEYEQNRDKYPTMDDFMPRVVKFFNDYARK